MMSSTTVLTLPVCSGIQMEVHKLASCKIGGGMWGTEKKGSETIFRNFKLNCLKAFPPQVVRAFYFPVTSDGEISGNAASTSNCLINSCFKKGQLLLARVVLKRRELLLK